VRECIKLRVPVIALAVITVDVPSLIIITILPDTQSGGKTLVVSVSVRDNSGGTMRTITIITENKETGCQHKIPKIVNTVITNL